MRLQHLPPHGPHTLFSLFRTASFNIAFRMSDRLLRVNPYFPLARSPSLMLLSET